MVSSDFVRQIEGYGGDEPEIRTRQIVVRAVRARHSPGDAQAIFGRGENPHRAGWASRRAQLAELCRREGIAASLYYTWPTEFLEAGKRRLGGDIARAATSGEVKDLRRQAQALKEVVAEQALELRLLKKSMIADGADEE